MPVRETIGRLLRRSSISRVDGAAPLPGEVSEERPSVRAASVQADLPRRFRVRRELGAGGMGVVYRAYDVELGHDVAVKCLSRLEPNQLYHLKSEFRFLAEIRHPNLVQLYELFASDRSCFFTMELVQGTDFLSFVRPEDRCDYTKLLDAARQLA